MSPVSRILVRQTSQIGIHIFNVIRLALDEDCLSREPLKVFIFKNTK